MSETSVSCGTWRKWTGEPTVEETVEIVSDYYRDELRFEDLCAAVRTAINEALPEGFELRDNELFGPAGRSKNLQSQLVAAIFSVDIAAIEAGYLQPGVKP
jgi:hypothetical protein